MKRIVCWKRSSKVSEASHSQVLPVGGGVGLAGTAQVDVGKLSDVTTRTDQHAGVLGRVCKETSL